MMETVQNPILEHGGTMDVTPGINNYKLKTVQTSTVQNKKSRNDLRLENQVPASMLLFSLDLNTGCKTKAEHIIRKT